MHLVSVQPLTHKMFLYLLVDVLISESSVSDSESSTKCCLNTELEL